MSYERWVDTVTRWEDEACLYKAREEDDDHEGKRRRLIAAGRLFDVENIVGCFKVMLLTRLYNIILLQNVRLVKV